MYYVIVARNIQHKLIFRIKRREILVTSRLILGKESCCVPKWPCPIASTLNDGDTINKNTVHMSMPPTLKAMSYWTIYAYGNFICVANAKKHLTINDYGVVATFEQECVLGSNDQRPIIAKLEYVGWVEEILELNYGVLNIVVLLCNSKLH